MNKAATYALVAVALVGLLALPAAAQTIGIDALNEPLTQSAQAAQFCSSGYEEQDNGTTKCDGVYLEI